MAHITCNSSDSDSKVVNLYVPNIEVLPYKLLTSYCFIIYLVDKNGKPIDIENIQKVIIKFKNEYCEYKFFAIYDRNGYVEESDMDTIELVPLQTESSESDQRLSPEAVLNIDPYKKLLFYKDSNLAKSYDLEITGSASLIAVNATQIEPLGDNEIETFTSSSKDFTLYIESEESENIVIVQRSESQYVGAFQVCFDKEHLEKLKGEKLYIDALIEDNEGSFITANCIQLANLV